MPRQSLEMALVNLINLQMRFTGHLLLKTFENTAKLSNFLGKLSHLRNIGYNFGVAKRFVISHIRVKSSSIHHECLKLGFPVHEIFNHNLCTSINI